MVFENVGLLPPLRILEHQTTTKTTSVIEKPKMGLVEVTNNHVTENVDSHNNITNFIIEAHREHKEAQALLSLKFDIFVLAIIVILLAVGCYYLSKRYTLTRRIPQAFPPTPAAGGSQASN